MSKECENCGATLNTENKRCLYCGSLNPNYTSKTKSQPTTFQTQQVDNSQKNINSKNSNFNVVIFILLLFVFWPAAIIYAIVSSPSKNKK